MLLRSVLILVLFFVLFWLYETFIFNPIYRKEVPLDFEQIQKQLCPQGTEDCSYQLQDGWQQKLANSIK
jgi:hypothetical protein